MKCVVGVWCISLLMVAGKGEYVCYMNMLNWQQFNSACRIEPVNSWGEKCCLRYVECIDTPFLSISVPYKWWYISGVRPLTVQVKSCHSKLVCFIA